MSSFVIPFYYRFGTVINYGSGSAKVRSKITAPVPLRQNSYDSYGSPTLVFFLSKPTGTAGGAPSGRLSVRVELMAAERLEAEGGGGGHAVTGSRSQDPDPDPLVRGMDPRIRIRIHPKM